MITAVDAAHAGPAASLGGVSHEGNAAKHSTAQGCECSMAFLQYWYCDSTVSVALG